MNNIPTFDDLRNQHVNEIIAMRSLPAPIEQAIRTVRRGLRLADLDPADGIDPVVGMCPDPDSSQDRTASLQDRTPAP